MYAKLRALTVSFVALGMSASEGAHADPVPATASIGVGSQTYAGRPAQVDEIVVQIVVNKKIVAAPRSPEMSADGSEVDVLARQKYCSAEADRFGLHGQGRMYFRAACKLGANPADPIASEGGARQD